jgi:hypothetical protein
MHMQEHSTEIELTDTVTSCKDEGRLPMHLNRTVHAIALRACRGEPFHYGPSIVYA